MGYDVNFEIWWNKDGQPPQDVEDALAEEFGPPENTFFWDTRNVDQDDIAVVLRPFCEKYDATFTINYQSDYDDGRTQYHVGPNSGTMAITDFFLEIHGNLRAYLNEPRTRDALRHIRELVKQQMDSGNAEPCPVCNTRQPGNNAICWYCNWEELL